MIVRPASPEDAAAVAHIYNQGIEDRVATFEVDLRTPDEVAQTLREGVGRYPAIVVEDGGHVIGFAWTSVYRTRRCYDGILEFSVYVERSRRGRGIGTLAMRKLIQEAGEAGFWKLISRIFPENRASLDLCDRLGFRQVGTYHRHAKLDGEWRDCVIVEKLLDPPPPAR